MIGPLGMICGKGLVEDFPNIFLMDTKKPRSVYRGGFGNPNRGPMAK